MADLLTQFILGFGGAVAVGKCSVAANRHRVASVSKGVLMFLIRMVRMDAFKSTMDRKA